MAASAVCPAEKELAAFSLGQAGESAAEVEEHLRDCPACLATLNALQLHDTLIDAMRTQSVLGEKPVVDEQVRAAIDCARRLYPGNAAPVEDPLSFLLPPTQPGDLGTLGNYRIRKVLGWGGMGIVFEAVDVPLGRPVALKVMRPGLAVQADMRKRFLREARAAATLDHENLVAIYQVGEENGLPFLAMPLLAGESLAARWDREPKLPLADVLQIAQETATGLAAAHAHGLIHRDIKPANIWLESRGVVSGGVVSKAADHSPLTTHHSPFRVKILDFGLARGVTEETQLTQAGILVGTPLYMAPEQADGQSVDARSDLFSLGSMLYGLSTGVLAFQASSTIRVLRAVCEKTPQPIRELNPACPVWLADAINKLLAKNPADRFQSAVEVAELFRRRRKLEQTPGASTGRRHVRWLAAAAVLFLIVGVGLGLAEVSGVTRWREWLSSDPQLTLRADRGISDSGPKAEAKDDSPVALESSKGQPATDTIDKKQQEEPAAKPQEAPRPVVIPAALFPFEERGAAARDYGAKVADLLFAKLAARPELYLVDRADLNKTLQELALNLSGAVKAGDASKVGQLTGAELLVTGSVVAADKDIYLVVKIIGTETSRIAGASVKGRSSDELGPLVEKLAEETARKIALEGDKLVAKAAPRKDRIAQLKAQLKGARLPTVWIQIAERHLSGVSQDPAAQTEIGKFCRETGFTVLDPEEVSQGRADVLIKGEGFSETAGRVGNLVSVRARLELKAVERKSGQVLFIDRQTAVVLDLAEQSAAKAALEEAAALLAERLLPRLVQQ